MSGEWHQLTDREYLEHLILTGWTDDEIVVKLGQRVVVLDPLPPDGPIPDGVRVLYLSNPPDVRRLRAFLAEMHGDPATAGCAPKLREVEVAYRKVGGRPLIQEVAVKMNNASPRTVSRSLRESKIMSWPEMHAHMAEHHSR